MTYSLLAVIGRDLRSETPSDFRDAVLVVGQDLELVHLVPLRLSDDDLDFGSYHVNRRTLGNVQSTWPGPPARALVDVETWGGPGYHFACVWSGSDDLLAPTTTADYPDDPPGGPWSKPPLRDNAVNRALRALGVTCSPEAADEFDTVGLGRGLYFDRDLQVSALEL